MTTASTAQDTIRETVATNDVVLFMKGTKQMPQCGFSSTVDGNALTIDQQKAKLRLVVETAEEVWGA